MTFFFFYPRISVKWRYAGILCLLPVIACQSRENTRVEDSPIIDSLLASAPHLVANTDIEPERWVATTRLGIPNDSLTLGRSGYMIAIGDSVYVSESSGHDISAMGVDGYISRQIGGQGQGPGEFGSPITGLQYSAPHVFVRQTGRVHVFTETFEYVDSFFSLDYVVRRFSVSPDYVFLECPGDPQETAWIVCARSTSPPHDWIADIKLLPTLDLPNQSGENANVVTVTPDGGRIAMAYLGLPYIFVYDDQFRQLRTIRFEGKQVQNFQPSGFPGAAGIELPDGAEAFTQSFIRTIKFINSRYLIAGVSKGGGLGDYIFDVSADDYRLAKKIIFRPMNDPEERGDVFADDYLLHGEHLYVSSQWHEYVYGFPFNLE